MTKILNFALKVKGVVGRVAHAKSSEPAAPQNLESVLLQIPRFTELFLFRKPIKIFQICKMLLKQNIISYIFV